MKEIFFGKKYCCYLSKNESKVKKWTSSVKKFFLSNRFVLSMIFIIISCFSMNIWLIHKFISILQFSSKMY